MATTLGPRALYVGLVVKSYHKNVITKYKINLILKNKSKKIYINWKEKNKEKKQSKALF